MDRIQGTGCGVRDESSSTTMELHTEKTLGEFILPDWFSENEVAAVTQNINEDELGLKHADHHTHLSSQYYEYDYFNISDSSFLTRKSVSSAGSISGDKSFQSMDLDINEETNVFNFGPNDSDSDIQLFVVPTIEEHFANGNGSLGFETTSDYYSGSSPDEDRIENFSEKIEMENIETTGVNNTVAVYDVNGELLDENNGSSFPFKVGNEEVVDFDKASIAQFFDQPNTLLHIGSVSSPLSTMPQVMPDSSVLISDWNEMKEIQRMNLPSQSTIDQNAFGELLRFNTSGDLEGGTSSGSTNNKDLKSNLLDPDYVECKSDPKPKPNRKADRVVKKKNSKPKPTNLQPKEPRKRKTSSSDDINSSTNKIRKRSWDINSFRYQIGPYLRIVSSVFNLTGLKIVLDDASYEVVRRFHPTDLYSTIYKSMIPYEHSKQVSMNEPDWSLWGADLQHEIRGDKIYFRSPFGDKGESNQSSDKPLVSLPKHFEINGKLNYQPETLCSVGSADLNVDVNLVEIAGVCTNVELKHNKYLLMRLKEPKSTGILFSSGKLIVIGCKTYTEFRSVTRKLARMVQKAGKDVHLTNLKLHYYIGIAKLPFKINIACLTKHQSLSEVIKFDFGVFPGVAMFVKSLSVMCFVCESGSVLMSDAVKPEDMKTALAKMYPCLKHFAY